MLTFVLTTDCAPRMEDAYELLSLGMREIGAPNYVFVIDLSGDAVFALRGAGIAVQVSESVREIPAIRGNCALIMSGDDRRDELLRDWFLRIIPQNYAVLEGRCVKVAIDTGFGKLIIIHERFNERALLSSCLELRGLSGA